jgi:glycosyltransferase involved in cell wall biosynthesis
MKLLILTQAVDLDHPYLGFFHRWLEEFAKECELVTVISLQKGRYQLPENVKVFSLGKEEGNSKLHRINNFYKYIFQESENYDGVFVHMNPAYVVLGGLFWRMAGKRIALWYTHRQVDMKLKIAEKIANIIFTASEESFTLKSKKVHIVGHGIDVTRFISIERKQKSEGEPVRIISVGRISPIKNCNTLIETAAILKKEWNKKFQIVFIGEANDERDEDYKRTLKELVLSRDLSDVVTFIGKVTQEKLPEEYARADLSVNLTPTGGVDKVVLESMASGVPVFSSNKTFIDYFGGLWSDLIFQERDARDLADKIIKFFASDKVAQTGQDLQKIAKNKADIAVLIKKILDLLQTK